MCFLLSFDHAAATTIVPFKNLGELDLHCDHVVLARMMDEKELHSGEETYFRQHLKVLQSTKGDLDIGEIFEIQKWEMKIGEMIRKMYGDVALEKGHQYLLFLNEEANGLFHPLCFSYYVFEEVNVNRDAYLMPYSGEEFILVDDRSAEPLFIYKKKALLDHLNEVVLGAVPWNSEGLIAESNIADQAAMHKRDAPSHCSFLSSGSNFRWTDFPEETLHVYYQAGGDGICSSIPTFIGAAISTLNQNYQGLNLTNGGTFSGFTPTCGSAHGSSYRDYILNTFGDSRRALIQFNDPCNEIPSLQNCGGTLAVGGLFGLGSHTYKGETWFNGAFGYVVLNDGVGNCYCEAGDYRDLIVHELSHSLGLGHIGSSSGMANLNPFCCNSIQSLDLECMNYSYEGIFLPVELSDFHGTAAPTSNELIWQTASEQNSDHFVLQRAGAHSDDFIPIATIRAAGNTSSQHDYHFDDLSPERENYYRLVMVDADGSTQHSEIISISRKKVAQTRVFPTTVESELFIQVPAPKDDATKLIILDVHGSPVFQAEISAELTRLDLNHLGVGTYFVQISSREESHTSRILRM